MKKKCMVVVKVLLVFAALALFIPLPRKIDRTLEGIRWKDGEEQSVEECTVTVEGWYFCYLFRDNAFKGDIEISGIEETSGEHNFVVDLQLRRHLYNFDGQVGELWFYVGSENKLQPMGTMVISGAFQEVFILNLRPADEGWLVSAPAENRQDALELGEKMTNALFHYQ